MNVFASFAVVKWGDIFAATTRAADKGEEGKIGLPGGKLDLGESPLKAVIREAKEEGWDLLGTGRRIHIDEVEGNIIHWFIFPDAVMRTVYKEKGRITPIYATKTQIVDSGYGNEFLKYY